MNLHQHISAYKCNLLYYIGIPSIIIYLLQAVTSCTSREEQERMALSVSFAIQTGYEWDSSRNLYRMKEHDVAVTAEVTEGIDNGTVVLHNNSSLQWTNVILYINPKIPNRLERLIGRQITGYKAPGEKDYIFVNQEPNDFKRISFEDFQHTSTRDIYSYKREEPRTALLFASILFSNRVANCYSIIPIKVIVAPPLSVDFRKSSIGLGRVFKIANISGKPLSNISIRFQSPRGNTGTYFVKDTLKPYETTEIGWSEIEWTPEKGEQYWISAAGYNGTVYGDIP